MSVLIKKFRFEELEFLMFVLDELADELKKQGKDIIKLTLGKSQEPLHQDIIEAYVEAIRNPEKRNLVYPEGLPELRKKIAYWYTSMGNTVNSENVIVNTGTSPLFKDLFRFLLEEGDEVLLPHPYYSVYHVSALLTPAKINFYSVDPDTLRINLEEFKSKFNPKKTKLVVVASPGNPYGNIVTEKEYKAILDIVRSDAYILSDEIYRNIGFYGKVPSILDNSHNQHNIIVSNAFSKGFRMYTARVGFFILPKQLIEPFRVLLQHTLLTVNPSAQFAAVEALNHLEEVEKITSAYRQRNEYAVQNLKNIEGIKVIEAQGGFYLVVFCDGFMKKKQFKTSLELAKDILLEKGVAVVPGSDFGVPTGLRISFTNLRFNEGIDRLAEYFINL
ncbi:MAG TPA: pyridoxal phosphate-dependent aminotransferase [Candidatus Wunengus sp. YC60]|uniref:pyridoxal phosphate-dependent aminotransferase n=1 Tax=Candidatus Wunengus sp. YC60 TaxID=3367697 RepID=UPI004024B71F